MASEDRGKTDALDLEQTLADTPHLFGFLSTLRKLECHFKDRPRLGAAKRPGEDAIRIGQDPHLDFAPHALAGYRPSTSDRPGRLATTMFGLFGPDGALPLHLTDHALARIHHHKDPTFARFVDLFHHRLATYFYRAWADARPTVSLDRPEEDPFSSHVGALIGIGMETLRKRDAVSDHAKLFFSGHLANQTKHADGLVAMLEGYFKVRVTIQEFTPEWLDLPPDSRFLLGAPGRGLLGVDTTIGARVLHCQHRFGLIFGPMPLDAYQAMTSEDATLERLIALVRSYVGHELDFDLTLMLNEDHQPRLQLGLAGALGRTSWLGGRQARHGAPSMTIDPVARLARKRKALAPTTSPAAGRPAGDAPALQHRI